MGLSLFALHSKLDCSAEEKFVGVRWMEGLACVGGSATSAPPLKVRARTGELTARDLGRVAPRKIPRRMGAQVFPSCGNMLGGQGG